MLRSLNELRDYTLLARDGDLGRCKDFLFDDQRWTIRFMVADTGSWLAGKKVLISPVSLEEPDWDSGRIPVALTKEEIEKAPLLLEHEPVSRRHEARLFTHYGWPSYWTGPALWGPVAVPSLLAEQARAQKQSSQRPSEEESEDLHLRSVNEVTRYDIEATDGSLGKVDDLIVQDELWIVRYMIIDTHRWLPGRRVIISPGWVEQVSWSGQRVKLNLSREQIKQSPVYDPSMPVNREYEQRLYDFYGRPVYWTRSEHMETNA